MDHHPAHGKHEHSHDSAEAVSGDPVGHRAQGVTVEQSGYLLQEVSAPATPGQHGELSFTITGPGGQPVTAFETSHEKPAHLIVVRSDGAHFRHVHPQIDTAGRWSVPWRWEEAGTYRVYTDVVPTGTGENLILTRTVDVAGSLVPSALREASSDEVDGFQVSLHGHLTAGGTSTLIVSVAGKGRPVTPLQPYLGAYGHLVALRAGDLAYLHVHPEGGAPVAGEITGPDVAFATTAPTPGRYYLYFDFQVDGQVHTAQFVTEATPPSTAARNGHH